MNPTQRPDAPPCFAATTAVRPRHEELCTLLFGSSALGFDLPPIADLTATLLGLAEGKRRKTILALASSTGEIAFVRRGEDVLLSYYDGGPVPQIFLRDRTVSLAKVLAACARAAREHCELGPPAERRTYQFMADRALSTELAPDNQLAPPHVTRSGGAQTPRAGSDLLFGFSAQVPQGGTTCMEQSSRADVHALLFDGELWAFAFSRRISLVRGPIYPAIARMISAARAVVDAWENQRPLTLRLKAGDFSIGVRLSRGGDVALTLSGDHGQPITLASLDVPSALLPTLRLGSDFARAVVTADRSQSRNLRLCALRDEVRALRRAIRSRSSRKSFLNRDAELLRARSAPLSARECEPQSPPRAQEGAGKLRLSLRWRAEVEGLDAAATFLCGDRLVIATPRSQLALSRDNGELLWVRHSDAALNMMAGTALVSVGHDGSVALCDVGDGETYATTRIKPRAGGPLLGTHAGGRGAPPIVVLAEGRDRLVAIDARTGEPRWRYRSRGRGDFRLTRAGQILLVVCGDSTLDAVDVSTGEVAWRWSDPRRILLPATVTRDRALCLSGKPGAGPGALSGFDLFSGEALFRQELRGAPLSCAIATDQLAVVSTVDSEQVHLSAFELSSGAPRWTREDPGLGEGGSPLVVDQHLVINSPLGMVCALDLDSGKSRWQHRLADAMRDDVPRKLEPILRGGALFLPSANVHVVRPSDGVMMSCPLSDSVIPDFMRVDERGWLYLAEESGHVEAYAPAPSLRLVRA